MRDDVYNFLIEDIEDALSVFEDENEAADEFMILLSVFGEIPESLFKLYLRSSKIDPYIARHALAYYMGMGKILVVCDCDDDKKAGCWIGNISRNNFYRAGLTADESSHDWYNYRMSSIKKDLGL